MMREKNNIKVVFIVMCLLYIIYRIFVLCDYCFQYTDGDQTLMWYATAAFGHGELLEPKFFGQNRNVMIESLLAVPFYWAGIPLHIALPISATIIGVFPFVCLMGYCIYKKNYWGGVLLLAYLSTMSVEYDVLTSVPRAFASGLALSIIAIILLECINSHLSKFVAGTLMVIACMWTAPSICLSLLGLLFYFMKRLDEFSRKFWRKHVSFVAGGLLGAYINLICDKVYTVLHPSYNVGQKKDEFVFSLKVLINNIIHLNDRTWADFFIFHLGIYTLFVFGVVVVMYIMRIKDGKIQKRYILIVGAAFGGNILSLAIERLIVGIPGYPLYSITRMLLYVPISIVLVVWFLYRLEEGKSAENKIIKKAGLMIPILIVAVCSGIKAYQIHETQREKFISSNGCVKVESVKNILEKSNNIVNALKENECTMVLFHKEPDVAVEPLAFAFGAYNFGEFDSYVLYNEYRVPYLRNESSYVRSKILEYYEDGSMAITPTEGKTLLEIANIRMKEE